MLRFLFMFLSVTLAFSAMALPDWITVRDDGGWKAGGLEFDLAHFASGYTRLTRQNRATTEGTRERKPGEFHLKGIFRVPSGNFDLAETVRRESGAEALRYSAVLTASPAIPGEELFLTTYLPDAVYLSRKLRLDGKEFSFPEKAQENPVLFRGKVRELEIPLDAGELLLSSSGGFRILIQDNRKFGAPSFSLRIYPETDNLKQVGRAGFDLTVDFRGIRAVSLDLRGVMNMGFRDKVAKDGKGGWTDQGPDNDLSVFQPGPKCFNGVDFITVKPEENNGRSALVLRGDRFPEGLAEATVNASGGGNYLYLLHAGGWTLPGKRVGTVEAEFPDGKKHTVEVKVGVDVGNWHNPEMLPNGAVAWKGSNGAATVGLYLSCFKLGETPPSRITFRSGDGPIWMIAGATLGDKPLRLSRGDEPVYITAGEDYVPVKGFKPVKAGTVLDLSKHLDKPAGKFGRIVTDTAGHLVFEQEPEKRIRMFGTNLCMSACFPTKAQAEKLADEFSRLGYNSVRLHHIERELMKKGAKHSCEFDPEKLDRLDYFAACLKERGLYLTIDLFSLRAPQPGELPSVSAQPNTTWGMKAMIPLERAAFENWCVYARNLLEHVNPYTKLRWADDPALYCLNLVNENSLPGVWDRSAASTKLYLEHYEQFLRKRSAFTPENFARRNGLFYEFLAGVQAASIRETRAFVRETLKSGVLITDLNWNNTPYLGLLRGELLDLVDNHQYSAHPSFPEKPWQPPQVASQSSAISGYANNPRGMMASRVFGKPFICTEFQFCFPNPHTPEGGVLMGAYPALQDWDGLYRFAWSHGSGSFDREVTAGTFDYSQSPERKLSEYLIYFQFVRGDVAPAKEGVAYPLDAELFRLPAFSSDYSRLGLLTRIGGIAPSRQLPGVKRMDRTDEIPQEFRPALAGKSFTSSTGEIVLNGESITVTAPRFECIAADKGNWKAGRFALSGLDGFATAAVASLDGKAVGESRHLLFFYLVEIKNTMTKFSAPDHYRLLEHGKLPLLARRHSAAAALQLAPGNWSVTAIDVDGSALGAYPAKYENGTLTFRPDSSKAFVYELKQ